jgi:hypothetical protein
MKFSETAMKENRFKQLMQSQPEASKAFMEKADMLFASKYDLLQKMAAMEPYKPAGA